MVLYRYDEVLYDSLIDIVTDHASFTSFSKMRGAKAQQSNNAHVDEQSYVDSRWEMLKTAIVEIQNKNNSGLSFEELYRNAYTMVLHKYGEVLYNGLVDTVTYHLRNHVRPVVENSISDNFISELIKCWNDHTVAMVMIRDILMYMDRVYVQQRQCLDPVYNLGLRMFRDEIVNNQDINGHLKATMLGMIALERQKESIDWMSLKHACKMLIALGIDSRGYYESQFETHFLRESSEYYHNAGQKFLAENSASVFVRKVNECLTEEKERAERYLDPITGGKILQVLQKELIVAHMHTIVDLENSGLVFMLNNDRVDDMKLLYQLLHDVAGGSKVVIEAMSKYLRAKGERLVSAENNGPVNPVSYIQSLIDLKAQFDHFLHRAFNDDKEFKTRIQTDFEYFLNLNAKSPEFLSLYIDDRLKKGLKSMNEGDADGVLDKAMVLFRFLQDKDIFEKYYKQHLAKRLLYAKSNSDDAEKSMITKLKTECGAHFTSKLEGMFKDMEVSSNLMNCFKDQETEGDIDLSVRVLTKGHWPTTDVPLCPLPPSAEAAFQAFKNFYLTKHNGRKLSLSPNLGLADLKAVFYKPDASAPGGIREESKILTVTTYQMCVLMRFNNADQMTYAQLQKDTQIPDRDLKRALVSLAMAKASQRVLARTGEGREIEPADVFSVNDAFTSKLTRIRIQMVANRNTVNENEPERREIRRKVEDDRKHEIEAAIVRVMKARKRITHNELIAEVTRQLQSRFRPEPIGIKRRIESLMDRQYVKRDDDDTRVYHYVA
uniref:CULLIN_2 domain-containing protein n=1 Tax=Panagrellus redivivus TaxID=6233 RepID=A0A7E4UWK1_PANRE